MKKLLLSILLSCASLSTYAATDCTSKISYIYTDVGSGAPTLTVVFASGTYFTMPVSDANFKAVFSLATLGMTTQKNMLVRYAGTGVSCTSGGRTDAILLTNYGGM